MDSIKSIIEDREEEINAYFDMIKFIHQSSTTGLPSLKGKTEFPLQPTHLHILYANTYLLLYNYIEAVITLSLETLTSHIKKENRPITAFLKPIQKEWLSTGMSLNDAKTSSETKIEKGLELFKQLTEGSLELKISKGGGGNFNDEQIFLLAKKLEIPMQVDSETHKRLRLVGDKTYQTSKKHKDSCMKEITRERNKLAHGEITFQECGKTCNVSDLNEIKETTFRYMRIFVNALEQYIYEKSYFNS